MAEQTLFSPADEARITELLQDFLKYLRAERRASRYTMINYEIDLRHWFKWLIGPQGERVTFGQLSFGQLSFGQLTDQKSLRDFLGAELKKSEQSTVNRRLSAIKGFLKFIHREGYIELNTAKLVSLPRLDDKLPHILKPEQVIRLIEGVPTDTLSQKRARAIIELLYSTGIRVSELAGLTHEKVNLRSGFVLVGRKGSKERTVPMGRHCQHAISDYIDHTPKWLRKGPKTPLFQNREGDFLSVRSVQRNLRDFAIEILGDEGAKVTPHTLRHSCATHLLAGGAGLLEIQQLLGHRSLVTTQKYAHFNMERLKQAYRQSHPKEKRRRQNALEDGRTQERIPRREFNE